MVWRKDLMVWIKGPITPKELLQKKGYIPVATIVKISSKLLKVFDNLI